jgi:hypothetical protein
MGIWDVSAAASGAARRVARQRVEVRVYERRSGYDAGLVRAQQMAVAIGGYRRYPGYAGFGLDSYAAGALDHTIGERPVFPPDVTDEAEVAKLEWEAAKVAEEAGYPLELYLEDRGWAPERIDKLRAEKDRRRALVAPITTPTAGGTPPETDRSEDSDAA